MSDPEGTVSPKRMKSQVLVFVRLASLAQLTTAGEQTEP